jgi:ribosome-associated heat shock protein Hsp15
LVRVGELEWKVEVLGFSARRGPASEAALLYAESVESRARREAMILMRRSGPQVAVHDGRPTKRDRRLLDRFKRGE